MKKIIRIYRETGKNEKTLERSTLSNDYIKIIKEYQTNDTIKRIEIILKKR